MLIISGVKGDTRRYRCFHLCEQLRLADIPSEFCQITDNGVLAKIANASAVIFHRVTDDSFFRHLLHILTERGCPIIMDVDDLIFDPAAMAWIDSPDFVDPVRSALYKEDMRRSHAALVSCQAVLASTQFLADQVKASGVPAWVHRNAFSLEMLALSDAAVQHNAKSNKKIVIGYASGTSTHDRDFQVVRPGLEYVLHHYPQVELWLVGPLTSGPWGELAARVRRLPLVPWRQLPSILAQFDINLAPLVTDNPFSRSKSEIKYVEAALVRAPTVASPTSAFAHAITSSRNGLLATDGQEWQESLIRLVEDPHLRVQMGRQAYEDVLAGYHPAARSKELVQTLNQIYLHLNLPPLSGPDTGMLQSQMDPHVVSAGENSFRVSPSVERQPTLLRRAMYTLRYRGLPTLVMQVWILLRRIVAPLFPFR